MEVPPIPFHVIDFPLCGNASLPFTKLLIVANVLGVF